MASLRATVARHPAVTSVVPVGSRARGDATALSDWDFLVESDDLDAVAAALPALLAEARPLAAQWDRLSEEATYFMLVLRDGTKVDFVLQRPPHLEPPWVVTAGTLPDIDAHFWDWIVWLGGKSLRGDNELVDVMLTQVMFDHLLAPLGAPAAPRTIADAVDLYEGLRAARERELGATVDARLGTAVRARLSAAGVI